MEEFKVGDKVCHQILTFKQTGMGTILSISRNSTRIWVKWENMKATLENPWQLKLVQDPSAILKEIL